MLYDDAQIINVSRSKQKSSSINLRVAAPKLLRNMSNTPLFSRNDNVIRDRRKMRPEVDRIRGYLDFIDEYGLHYFVIWHGRVVRDTPEYASMMDTYKASWSLVSRCINILEIWMTVNSVPLAIINGKKLGILATFDLERVDEVGLCHCIVNLEQIRPYLRHLKLVWNTCPAAQLAASMIQAAARGFLDRLSFFSLRTRHQMALILQRYTRGALCRARTDILLIQYRSEKEFKWQALQKRLKEEWRSGRDQERVIIYLRSSTRADELRIGDNNGMLCWLADPKIHVICVSRSLPSEELLKYYQQITEKMGIPDVHTRCRWMMPENVMVFPTIFSLISLLLYSPSSLKRIICAIKERPAFIVACETSWQIKTLAVALGIPTLSAEPTEMSLLRTQSGMKHVFATADITTPLGAHDIYDEDDLLVSLAKLIASNLDIQRWYIKLNPLRGNLGLAIIESATIGCIEALKKEKAQLRGANGDSPSIWYHSDIQLLARSKLLKGLREKLRSSVTIVNKNLFPSWECFLATLRRVGGVIEAEPPGYSRYVSSNVFLSPSGGKEFLSQTEMVADINLNCIRYSFPQDCIPKETLLEVSSAISRVLLTRGMMGYFSFHFVIFWDSEIEQPHLWAKEIEVGMSISAYSYCFFHFITRRPRCSDDFPYHGTRENDDTFHSSREL